MVVNTGQFLTDEEKTGENRNVVFRRIFKLSERTKEEVIKENFCSESAGDSQHFLDT